MPGTLVVNGSPSHPSRSRTLAVHVLELLGGGDVLDLAELDPAVYVLDGVPNMNAREIDERALAFVRILLTARPRTPVLLVEDRTTANAAVLEGARRRHADNRAALRKVYEQLVADKAAGVHYLAGDALIGGDGEATVDGSHPTDLGFLREADAFQKALLPLLP